MVGDARLSSGLDEEKPQDDFLGGGVSGCEYFKESAPFAVVESLSTRSLLRVSERLLCESWVLVSPTKTLISRGLEMLFMHLAHF